MPRPRSLAPMLLLAASLGSARTAVAATAMIDELGYPTVGNAMKGGSAPEEVTAEQQRALAKLKSTPTAKVRADLTPFLPLCDAAGYPLVGNALGPNKVDRMKPSEVCTAIREQRAAEKARQ